MNDVNPLLSVFGSMLPVGRENVSQDEDKLPSSQHITLQELLDQYATAYEAQVRAESTMKALLTDLSQVTAEIGYGNDRQFTRHSDFYNFAQQLKEVDFSETGYSPKTINRKIAFINGFLRYMHQVKLIQEVLCIDSVNEPNLEGHEILPYEHYIKFLDALSNTDFLGLRNASMFSLMYLDGLRTTDVTSLGIQDIQYEGRKPVAVTIGEKTKTRQIAVHPDTTAFMMKYESQLDGRKPVRARLTLSERSFYFLNNFGFAITPRSVRRQHLDQTRAHFGSEWSTEDLRPNFIYSQIQCGRSLEDIAHQLGVGKHTVNSHYQAMLGFRS